MSHTFALVDDDRNLLTSISIALEREGFKVQTYIDGEAALNGLTRNPPDLAIIDIKMPTNTQFEKKAVQPITLSMIFSFRNEEDVLDKLVTRVRNVLNSEKKKNVLKNFFKIYRSKILYRGSEENLYICTNAGYSCGL